MRTRRDLALAPIFLSNSRKDTPIAGSQCVFNSQSDTLYIVYFGNFWVYSFRDLQYKLYHRWRICLDFFSFSLPVGRTHPFSWQDCWMAVAAAHCCPFRCGESLRNLTGCLTSKFPNRSVRYISKQSASHMLLQYGIDWYRTGNVNTTKGHRVSCIHCLLCSVLHFFARTPFRRKNVLHYRSRVAQSIVYFLCISLCVISNVFQTKITNSYWRIHL